MIFHLYKHFLLQVQLRSICAGVGRGVGDRQGEYIVIVFVTCIRKCLCNVEKSGKFLSGFLNLDHHSIPPFPLLASAPPASASPAPPPSLPSQNPDATLFLTIIFSFTPCLVNFKKEDFISGAWFDFQTNKKNRNIKVASVWIKQT